MWKLSVEVERNNGDLWESHGTDLTAILIWTARVTEREERATPESERRGKEGTGQ